MRVMITGATSGIAYLVAVRLIQRGHRVFLCTHTEKECDELKKKLKDAGVDACCMKVDVTENEDIERASKIDLDCLISHAGVGISGSLLDLDIDCLKEVYDVNLYGNFLLLQKVYQHMEARNIPGKIFVTSSLAGMLPFPYLSCYTSSKAAISMIVFTMRKELKARRSRVQISLIEPGAYHTGFNQWMIENHGKENYSFSGDCKTISRLQRNLFALIERYDLSSIVRKVVKEVEKDKSHFHVRSPFLQVVFTKIYLLFFR